MPRDPDPDIKITRDQDNFNNFGNWMTSRSIGDRSSASHWRDNYFGGAGVEDTPGEGSR